MSGGFMIFKNLEKQKKPPIQRQLLVSEPVIAEEITKDKDDNGLKDWEKALHLVAGVKNPENAEETAASQSSLTNVLSRSFFSNYLTLKQSFDKTLDEASQQKLIDSFLADFESSDNLPLPKYAEIDIKISPNDGENSIRDYGNNLALIIKKYFDPLPETEMTIFAKALKESEGGSKESNLTNLEPIANAYRNTAKEIVALPTPASFADSHLKLANYFNNIAKEINELQDFSKDPAQTMLAFKQYQADAKEAYLILLSLNAYFADKKVVFESGEPAKFFKIYVAAAIAAQTNE